MHEDGDRASPLNIPRYDNPFADWSGCSDFERHVAECLRVDGFCVFDFPDDQIARHAEQIQRTLEPVLAQGSRKRLQDMTDCGSVREIAANTEILQLLETVYGRPAFPFQTLNFRVGTEQTLHSDHVHFDSLPHRFMAGVWVALEDMDEDNGPLFYYPGSHRWPALYNLEVGVHQDTDTMDHYHRFTEAWAQYATFYGVEPERFRAKQGQCLIWTSNLVHGGSRQLDRTRTRWSQVTHYYFADCAYYTPVYSNPSAHKFFWRDVKDLRTGQRVVNRVNGHAVGQSPVNATSLSLLEFEADRYLELNPDVERDGVNPYEHFITCGIREGRQFR